MKQLIDLIISIYCVRNAESPFGMRIGMVDEQESY